jgi:hypothetical protein
LMAQAALSEEQGVIPYGFHSPLPWGAWLGCWCELLYLRLPEARRKRPQIGCSRGE